MAKMIADRAGLTRSMGQDSWTTLAQDLILDRTPYLRVFQERVRTSSGVVIDDYYRVSLPDFVVCVPVLKDGRIVTLWQYKHGPRGFGLTFPAGYIDQGETPETACVRELVEETGYRALQVTGLGRFVEAGNQDCGTGHYFLGRDCAFRQAADSGDLETARLRLMTRADIDGAMERGEVLIGHHALAWLLARNGLDL